MLKRSKIVNDPHKYLVLFTYLLLGLCPTFMIRGCHSASSCAGSLHVGIYIDALHMGRFG